MSSLGCGDFFRKSGWHCQVVPTANGNATYISTPIVLPGGKPLDFYLIQRGNLVEFTDDGITMFALRSLGYALGDKRNWRGLENIASRLGFQLTDAGCFETIFPETEMAQWGSKIVRLMSAIAAWEEERFAEGDTDFSLTDEVELLLRSKDPSLKLSRDVSVTVGKTQVSFDFLWGSTYVDAVAPVQQSINARLRKAILMNRGDEVINMLFIIDDRSKKQKAIDETSVLGDISPTILLSDFEKHYSSTRH